MEVVPGETPPLIELPCPNVLGWLGIRTCGWAQTNPVGSKCAKIPIANSLHKNFSTRDSSLTGNMSTIFAFEEAG